MNILKYSLEITDIQTVQMPSDAKILSVQMQRDNLCLWALVNPDLPSVHRTFEVIGTGNPVTPQRRDYLGTVQAGPFVWHIFELP